jgi:hypothetical protein
MKSGSAVARRPVTSTAERRSNKERGSHDTLLDVNVKFNKLVT